MNKKLFIPVAMLSIAVVLSTLTGCGKIDSEKNGTIITGNQNTNVQAKEFVMTSFTEIIDGKYFPQYSIKEITVKK
ncbi:TPA: hypothetical protein DCZ39_01310 [Patescibacteria group bacterium]|nr:hypothetical protein [Candidatus Gracilibacteria bacterium]